MAQKQTSNECAIICWGIATLVGLLSMVMLYFMGGFSALQAIFCGGVIGFVLGLVLSLFICRGQKAAADLADEGSKPANRYAAEALAKRTDPAEVRKAGSAGTDAGSAGGAGAGAGATGAASAAAGAAAPAPGADATAPAGTMAAVSNAGAATSAVKPSKELPGQKELAARKGEWKYEKPAEDAPAKPASAPAPAAAAPASAEAPAKVADVPSSADVEEEAPKLLDGPRAEGKDDLKKISGVGPKLEETLNSMGVWHFDQIAVWGPQEIAWVDARLRFKGRIERDDWMSQAKILAEGGETEFSRKKK